MSKFLVTRIRHQLEALTVEASSSTEAIEKARKSLRKDWNHIDSKKRRAYKAELIDMSHPHRTR